MGTWFLFWEDVVVLKELVFNSFYFLPPKVETFKNQFFQDHHTLPIQVGPA